MFFQCWYCWRVYMFWDYCPFNNDNSCTIVCVWFYPYLPRSYSHISSSHTIYWNKRKCLHKKRVSLPQDWFVTLIWPPFHCFGTPIWLPWCHVYTLQSFQTVSNIMLWHTLQPTLICHQSPDSTSLWLPPNCAPFISCCLGCPGLLPPSDFHSNAVMQHSSLSVLI